MYKDLKYGSATLDLSYRTVADGLHNAAFVGLAKAFVANMDRIDALLKLPSSSFWTSYFWFRIQVITYLETCGPITDVETLDNMIDIGANPKFSNLVIGSFEKHIGILIKTIDGSEGNWEQLAKVIDLLPKSAESAFIDRGLEAVFAGAVTGAWTAFETLAGDLWVAAINTHPHGLAELAGKRKRIVKLADTRIEKSEQPQDAINEKSNRSNDSRSISLEEIQRLTKGTYNLNADMSNILKNIFKFTNLTGIREAYASAFCDHADSIDSVLGDTNLDAISLVRNLIWSFAKSG